MVGWCKYECVWWDGVSVSGCVMKGCALKGCNEGVMRVCNEGV